MSVITTAERAGLKKGIQEGMQKGIEKGIVSVHKAVANLIKVKFGSAGDPLFARAEKIRDLELLDMLIEELSGAADLAAGEQVLDKIEKMAK